MLFSLFADRNHISHCISILESNIKNLKEALNRDYMSHINVVRGFYVYILQVTYRKMEWLRTERTITWNVIFVWVSRCSLATACSWWCSSSQTYNLYLLFVIQNSPEYFYRWRWSLLACLLYLGCTLREYFSGWEKFMFTLDNFRLGYMKYLWLADIKVSKGILWVYVPLYFILYDKKGLLF